MPTNTSAVCQYLIYLNEVDGARGDQWHQHSIPKIRAQCCYPLHPSRTGETTGRSGSAPEAIRIGSHPTTMNVRGPARAPVALYHVESSNFPIPFLWSKWTVLRDASRVPKSSQPHLVHYSPRFLTAYCLVYGLENFLSHTNLFA